MTDKLLIVSDDFTGALDTSTQFAKYGISTVTFASPEIFWELECWPSEQVCAVSTNSRHMDAEGAFCVTRETVKKAVAMQADGIYKKVDSALRGNVGTEIDAVLDVIQAPILLAPAYPENGRTTCKGLQYVNGVPIHETSYGEDPFEPVRTASILEILGRQSTTNARSVTPEMLSCMALESNTVYVVDATEPGDLSAVARMPRSSRPWILSGSAGLAAALAALQRREDTLVEYGVDSSRIIIISGSLSPISNQQIRILQEKGVCVAALFENEIPQVLQREDTYCRRLKEWLDVLQEKRLLVIKAAGCRDDGKPMLAEKMETGREQMAKALSVVAQDLRSQLPGCDMLVIGGDTLQAIATAVFSGKLYPKRELEVGVPISVARQENGGEMAVISKSGSFGDAYLLERILNEVLEGNEL